jgi:hypothetical protein
MRKKLLIINFFLIQNIRLNNQNTENKTQGALQLYAGLLLPIIYIIGRRNTLKNLFLGESRKKNTVILWELPLVLGFSSVCFQDGIYKLTQEKNLPGEQDKNKHLKFLSLGF